MKKNASSHTFLSLRALLSLRAVLTRAYEFNATNWDKSDGSKDD
jgi:hypothetical protein